MLRSFALLRMTRSQTLNPRKSPTRSTSLPRKLNCLYRVYTGVGKINRHTDLYSVGAKYEDTQVVDLDASLGELCMSCCNSRPSQKRRMTRKIQIQAKIRTRFKIKTRARIKTRTKTRRRILRVA